MFRSKTPLALSALILAASSGVHAGTLTTSGWTPSGCGTEPAVQKLDVSNIDAYNASIDKVEKYRTSNRQYLDCLVKEANADVQRITQAAKTGQQAAVASESKIVNDFKAAGQKLDEAEEKAANGQ